MKKKKATQLVLILYLRNRGGEADEIRKTPSCGVNFHPSSIRPSRIYIDKGDIPREQRTWKIEVEANPLCT
jgi:hypothetical protein